MTDMNQPRLSGIVRLIRITFAILIWFQLLFGTFFSIYFYYRGYFDRWRDAVFTVLSGDIGCHELWI